MLPLQHRGPHGIGGPADAVGSRARARAFQMYGAFWSEGEEKLGAQPFVFPHRFPPHSYWLLPLPWEGDGQASWTEGSKEPSAAHVTRD